MSANLGSRCVGHVTQQITVYACKNTRSPSVSQCQPAASVYANENKNDRKKRRDAKRTLCAHAFNIFFFREERAPVYIT